MRVMPLILAVSYLGRAADTHDRVLGDSRAKLVANPEAKPLRDPQRWYHALFLAGLGSKLVGDLVPNFHGVALTRVNAVQGHILMHTILLLRSDLSAGLRTELQSV